MLNKLIKYELKATGRNILPLYSGLIAISIILRILYSNFSLPNNNLSHLAIVISIFIYGFIMAAVFVATFFIIVQRFYKNLLGDEGYLMHTLPLMPSKNILSKLITSSLWSIVSCIIALVSIFILIVNKDFIDVFFYNILPGIKNIFEHFGSIAYIVSLEILILGILQLIQSILKLYTSISIGHLFNKSKIPLSIVAFIALVTLEGFITSIFYFNLDSIFESFAFSSDNSIYGFNLLFTITIGLKAIYSAAYFFITNYILKNKLNLE
ncbi:MAG: ABC transporter permease [Clostridium butyricum]|nr:ABC transporter permease [Clostridium butyricum]